MTRSPDRKVYRPSITFYFHESTIKIYSTRPVLKDGNLVYHAILIFGCLMGYVTNFCLGVSAIRNAQLWAERQILLVSEANYIINASADRLRPVSYESFRGAYLL